MAQARLSRWFGGHEAGTDPDALDPEVVEQTVRRLTPVFGRQGWNPVEVQGWEHLHEEPALLVANHSGGTSVPDQLGFGWAWGRRFGGERPLHGLVHDMIFASRRGGAFAEKCGMLRAGPAQARAALLRGRDVLICPGGDLDVWRPWTERNQVCFGGRTGYARLALEQGVPITPVANCGPHETLMVLTDGHRLAQRVGLQKLTRASIWPVHLSLPWGVGVGPFPHVPWPVRLQYRFGPPVALPAGGATEENVAAYDVAVRAVLQEMLLSLAAQRSTAVEAVEGVLRVGSAVRRRVRHGRSARLAA